MVEPEASPAVAVTVRPLSTTLSVRLTLALPLASVTEEVAASFALPVVLQFTVTPETALPVLSVTVAWATFGVTPSAGELSVVMLTVILFFVAAATKREFVDSVLPEALALSFTDSALVSVNSALAWPLASVTASLCTIVAL